MNYKRKRPKEARSGCLMCKPWKFMGNRKEGKKFQELKQDELAKNHISSSYS